MKSWSRLAIGVLLLATIVVPFVLFHAVPKENADATIAYSEFMDRVDQDAVKEVVIDRREAHGSFVDGRRFHTTLPADPAVVRHLLDRHVRVELTAEASETPPWTFILLMGIPLLLLFGTPLLLRLSGPNRGAETLGFGRSRARLLAPGQRPVTLADVAGIDEAEEELKEIVEFLRNPEKFQRLGGKMPKGCLLIGPPGTGKTLLARAIAGEANVPFYTISGSDFVEMFVGVGAARVRDMFAQAKQTAPCIIFVDELDAVGRRRGIGFNATNDEREQTLNQLLVEMDGFDSSEGIILLAATNRPDILDPALLRPGRFDRQIVLTNPDVVGRQQILKVHLRNVPLAPDVDVAVIARGTPGFSGADLANLINEAALLAARRDKRFVSMAEFEEAKDKVLMGLERRSIAMTEKEKRTTAYHEAGHALVTIYTPGSDPLHKVTIVPRGRTLGITMSLPERDRYGYAKSELEAKLAVMFGGRAAEELVFGPGDITTGAADDIRNATELARRMVVEYGFSTKLGPLNYGYGELGTSAPLADHRREVSDATAALVDEETRRVAEEGLSAASEILKAHLPELHIVAKALLDHETLSGKDIRGLLGAPMAPAAVKEKKAGMPAQARSSPDPTQKIASASGVRVIG